MLNFYRKLFALILVFLATREAIAQIYPDSLVNTQYVAATQQWHHSLKRESGIYNGKEYIDYTRILKEGHPYFDSTVSRGSVHYNHIVYDNVSMLLDLIRDDLVAVHFNNIFLIELVKSKVDWFTLKGHFFEHLGRDSSTRKENISPGFYDRLYAGDNIKYYVKRVKVIQEIIPHMTVERIVHEADRYYIYKDGQYHNVRSKPSVLKLLGNKRQLNQALKQNRIRFRSNREAAIRLMVQTYDSL